MFADPADIESIKNDGTHSQIGIVIDGGFYRMHRRFKQMQIPYGQNPQFHRKQNRYPVHAVKYSPC